METAIVRLNQARVSDSDVERAQHLAAAEELLGSRSGVAELLTAAALEQRIDDLLDRPSTRLVVYGSLAPGEPNHHIVEHLGGEWTPCELRGVFGAWQGYRTFVWEPDGPRVTALLLTSELLPAAWPSIDEFEGEAYRRILVPVDKGARRLIANVYTEAARQSFPRNSRTGGEMRS